MSKALVFKNVNSDVESRLKEFEKLRIKLKSDIVKAARKKESGVKESKGIFKSISSFFADNATNEKKTDVKK